MKGMEDLDNLFHWLGNLEEKVISGDQSFWEFKVNLTKNSGQRAGIFKKILGLSVSNLLKQFYSVWRCVIFKRISIKCKNRKICNQN